MSTQRANLDDIRRFYADMMSAASGSIDPRIARAFDTVPREAFLPPGPWTIAVPAVSWSATAGLQMVTTPTADPAHLYQNVLVALDATQGINNGEPKLHAAWLGAAAPAAGEAVTHIGAGAGYYSAILSMLVLPGGTVMAFEIDEKLAGTARRNLAPFDNVRVVSGNAVDLEIPPSDLIYVNAGVVAPPSQWLSVLRPGGRLIFPWRPAPAIGLAALVTRTNAGFEFKPLMHAYFIPCVGASMAGPDARAPDDAGARRTRSVRLTAEQPPDNSATAVYEDVWFSDRPPQASE
jgi:protein-L-isoaspartate(D-aspartate) O-methyltransferase